MNPCCADNATKLTLVTSGSGRMQVFVDEKGRTKFETIVGSVVDPGNHQSYGYSEASGMYIHYKTPEQFKGSNFWRTMKVMNRTQCKDLWKKSGQTKLLGLPVTRYSRRWDTGVEELYVTTALPLKYDWVREYVVASGGDTCPKGFPLKDTVILPGRKRQAVLECVELKTVTVQPDFFSVPKGYKLTNDDWQVYLGGVADSLLYIENSERKK